MQCNLGATHRVIRVVAGLALVVWAILGGPLWAWIGVVPLLTGAVGWCPAYRLFGIKACPAKVCSPKK